MSRPTASKPSLRQTALITGASSGIGFDLAHVMADHGYDLVLVARSKDKLEQLSTELSSKHGIQAVVLVADLRNPATPTMIFDMLAARQIHIDILINNAGFGTNGRFAENDLQAELELIQVNISALTELTRLVLPAMVSRNSGRIMNVASTAAFQPGPLMATYYASKAYVLHFTEAIADELRHTNITCTALCPGPTRTNFAAIATMTNSQLFNSPLLMNSMDVARFGYKAMLRGQRVAIPGLVNWLVAQSTRFAPRRVATTLSRMVQEIR